MRLDRALAADLRSAARSPAVPVFLALQVLAGLLFVARRGPETLATVVLIWVGMLCLAFFAWWAGRDRRAHPRPDPVPAAGPRASFAFIAAAGMLAWPVSREAGFVLLAVGFGGWAWAALRSGAPRGLRERLTRDPRPFVPLLLLIALPRLLIAGPAFLVGLVAALPSGIGQQLLFLVGLFGPLEAASGRTDVAAVVAALVFGLVHVPIVMDANAGDLLAALANAMLFQASVGLIACLAYVRHRAGVPIGVAHALAL